ncbi:hypothetical protein [Congregibacter sp.]|uniref:hypothetical protein n=1 Tax=Congregibacter sp. TaxID=2744308 RepID=UPI00385F59D5
MTKEQTFFWIQLVSVAALLIGVVLVVVQLQQNEELLRFQLATDLRANRDSLRTATLGEDYSSTLAKLNNVDTLNPAELQQFSAHAFSVYYELSHRWQLFDEGIFVGDWTRWLLDDRCLLFNNPTGQAWLNWMTEVTEGDDIIEQIRKDLPLCGVSFSEFIENNT